MNLYIQIVGGQPFEHPLLEENLRQVVEGFDPQNLPEGLAPFERVDNPNNAGVYEKQTHTYAWVDGVIKDVWGVAPMTDDERTEKVRQLTDAAKAVFQKMSEYVNVKMLNATPSELETLNVYRAQLDAWVLIDPATPNLPFVPMDDATFVASQTDLSGSAPNVIG